MPSSTTINDTSINNNNNHSIDENVNCIIIPIDPKNLTITKEGNLSNDNFNGDDQNKYESNNGNDNKEVNNGNDNKIVNNGNDNKIVNNGNDDNKQKQQKEKIDDNRYMDINSPTVKSLSTNSIDYTQSPFNPLLTTTTDTTSTTNTNSIDNNKNIMNTSAYNVNENEELSLATSQFKRFVDETLKRISHQSNNNNNNNHHHNNNSNYTNHHNNNNYKNYTLKSHLILPQQNNHRWALKIFGGPSEALQEAKREILAHQRNGAISDEEVDMEASLRTSQTIESILSDEQGGKGENDHHQINQEVEVNGFEMDFPTMAWLVGPLLGPKYHVIKTALVNHNCIISISNSSNSSISSNSYGVIIPVESINSAVSLSIKGPGPSEVSEVIQLLKDRSDLLDETPLAISTVVIDNAKMDWILASGAIKALEESLWSAGATLTQISGPVYQVTCLTAALQANFMRKLHAILSTHQSAHFTFRFRNDYRDFSIKCGALLESLAQATNCSITQSTSTNTTSNSTSNTVRVEIGGSANDLARALIRIDNMRSQIFDRDLKLIERRLRLHVPADIRDFISGKKDGKLNRIVKETGVGVNLIEAGGDSMYVDLEVSDQLAPGNVFGTNYLLHALQMIEGELPAELTFHIPEIHHKRMIGHGGKVIQSIMKKWGVYVKFMNSQETLSTHSLSDPFSLNTTPTTTTNTVEFLDNVVVKTPSKNSSALQAIRDEIFEECSVNEITGAFDIDAFNSLKRIQNSAKNRISIAVPLKERQMLRSLLTEIASNPLQCHLLQQPQRDLIILEGPKSAISQLISTVAQKIKANYQQFDFQPATSDLFAIKPSSHPTKLNSAFFTSSSILMADESFKFFPSALFVVQNHQSLSASGSPILSFDSINQSSPSSSSSSSSSDSQSFTSSNVDFSASPALNNFASMNASPPLPVGHQKRFECSEVDSSDSRDFKDFKEFADFNSALAMTRRRSADIF